MCEECHSREIFAGELAWVFLPSPLYAFKRLSLASQGKPCPTALVNLVIPENQLPSDTPCPPSGKPGLMGTWVGHTGALWKGFPPPPHSWRSNLITLGPTMTCFPKACTAEHISRSPPHEPSYFHGQKWPVSDVKSPK